MPLTICPCPDSKKGIFRWPSTVPKSSINSVYRRVRYNGWESKMVARPIKQFHEVTEILGLERHTAEVHLAICPAQQLPIPLPPKNKERENSLGVPYSLAE